MKKNLIIALAFVAFQVSAQEHHREGHSKAHAFQDLSAEEAASLQTKKMTLYLNLNDKQQKDIYALNLKNAQDRKTFMENRKSKKESGEMQKPSKEDRLKMINARLDHQIEMKDKMRSILDDDQFSKWEKIQARKHAKREGTKRDHGKKRKK